MVISFPNVIAFGGALLLVMAAFGHLPQRRALALWELVVAGSVLFTPYAVALLYGAFTIYLVNLRRRDPRASCGCFRGDGPVTWLVVGRAVFFAIGAAVEPGVPLPLALAGGFVLAMAGWLLPELAGVIRQPLGGTRTVEKLQ